MKKLVFLFMAVIIFASPIYLLNQYRMRVGLNSLSVNQTLSKAAFKHAEYLSYNHIFSHYEDSSLPKFIGITPGDRAISQNYPSRFIVENISSGQPNYEASIKDLFSAIYHRLGFLNFNIDEIGYAKYNKIYVYDMGNTIISNKCLDYSNVRSGYIKLCRDSNKLIPESSYLSLERENPKVVMWPYPDMTDTPVVFYDEIPDPLPDYKVSGYPISISFNPYYYKKVELIEFKILNSDIPTRVITSQTDVNHILKYNEIVLFPLKRLEAGKVYKVLVRVFLNGEEKEFFWSFKTGKVSNQLVVTPSNKVFYIKPNKTYFIYFQPQSNNDVIKNFRYSYRKGIHINDIGFKDANTIRINVSGNGKVTLQSAKHSATLIIQN